MEKDLDVGTIIDAIPVDSRDGLIQVITVGKPLNFAVQYAPGSDQEMVRAMRALEEKFPSQSVYRSMTVIYLPDKKE